jgi:ankyrin repeat protein
MADMNAKNKLYLMPLYLAAQEGYLDIVKVLLTNGAKAVINARYSYGFQMALYNAAEEDN